MPSPREPTARSSSKSSKKNKLAVRALPPASSVSMSMLRIGRIVGAHALRGGIRVRLDNPESDTLDRVNRVFIGRDGRLQEFRLKELPRLNVNAIRINLEGVDDADAAESLRGAIVTVAMADLPPIATGEFYYDQMVGCDVMLTDGGVL